MLVGRGPLPFDRFMRALHRRFVLLRVAERVGVGILIASGAAACLLPLAWWRGVASLPIVLFVLGAGAAIGLIAGIVRRPTRMDAAAQADRQLKLADLLGTAVMIRRRRTPQPWDATVIASANERCRRLSPSSVILYRWGARAWGGVLLGACLVLVLSLTITQPAPTQAEVAVVDPFGGQSVDGVRRAQSPGPIRAASSNGGNRTVSPHAQQQPRDADPSSAHSPTSLTASASSANASAASAARGNSADPFGGGAGSRSTPGPGVPSSVPQDDMRPTANEAPGNSATPRKGGAGGAGEAGDGPVGLAGGAPGGEASGHHATAAPAPAPPWRTSSWPAQQQQQLDQTLRSRSGEYDAYQDLIRAYFERE
jgi:hypothetical protein